MPAPTGTTPAQGERPSLIASAHTFDQQQFSDLYDWNPAGDLTGDPTSHDIAFFFGIVAGVDGTATPATVVGIGDVPAPTAIGDATAAPATVVGIGSVPAPTATGTATASPAQWSASASSLLRPRWVRPRPCQRPWQCRWVGLEQLRGGTSGSPLTPATPVARAAMRSAPLQVWVLRAQAAHGSLSGLGDSMDIRYTSALGSQTEFWGRAYLLHLTREYQAARPLQMYSRGLHQLQRAGAYLRRPGGPVTVALSRR
jgi:hypothetical protein